MPPPLRLVDYPWVVVRIDCTLCDRYGEYRLARLAARYGPEKELDRVLADVAHTCPWWRTRPRRYEPRCGARFLDLERALPPADVPPEPVYRRKPPAREDIAPIRAPIRTRTGAAPALTLIRAAPIAWDPGPTLATLTRLSMTIACNDCRRTEDVVTADVIARFRPAMRLSVALRELIPNCPRRARGDGQCQAKVVDEPTDPMTPAVSG